MKLVATKEIKKIWKVKNYGSVVYHLNKHGIKPIEQKVVDNKFTKLYKKSDIERIKDEINGED